MHSFTRRSFAAAMVVALASGSASLAQQSTAFTYQGLLQQQGEPYTGTADVVVRLWTSESGDEPATNGHSIPNVQVVDGLFEAPLNFGAQTFAGDRWLQIGVRTPAWDGQGEEPDYFVFPGRQRMSPAPYSLQTRGIVVSEDG